MTDTASPPGTDYSLQLLLQGSSDSCWSRRTVQDHLHLGSAFTGSVGLGGSQNSATQFDNLTVQQYNPAGGGTLPISRISTTARRRTSCRKRATGPSAAGATAPCRYDGGDAVSTLSGQRSLPANLEST